MDCWGLIAAVISAVDILSMLIFSVNENVAMAPFFPSTLLSFCVCVNVCVYVCVCPEVMLIARVSSWNLISAELCCAPLITKRTHKHTGVSNRASSPSHSLSLRRVSVSLYSYPSSCCYGAL